MERLTTRREDGRIETRGISYSEFHMDYVPSARINDYYDMRLAAYEDTGLTPEELAAANDRVKVLERALEIACKYTECPYTDSIGSALPCDNNDLNCSQCFIAQAKEGRP
jgi:hypothetical protein